MALLLALLMLFEDETDSLAAALRDVGTYAASEVGDASSTEPS